MLQSTEQSCNETTVRFSPDHPPAPPVGNAAVHGRRRALRILSQLQTTLELEPLVRLYSREMSSVVTHSGLSYRNETHDLDLSIGRAARQSSAYRIVLGKTDFGELRFYRGRPFTRREVAQLKGQLGTFVYPLRNALLYKLARDAAMTDPLTGAYNRSVMQAALQREVGLARRHGTPLTLLLLDIDGLKRINDRHGHPAGDKLLRETVRRIRGCLRKTDVMSRFGGDEFSVLLSNTASDGATVLAGHIMDRLWSSRCDLGPVRVQISASIGAASLNPDDDPQALFSRADSALYEAKRGGRKRIQIALDS